MMTGSLLIFAFFHDHRSTNDNLDSRLGRILFAVVVAATAHWLAFFAQVRPALYFSSSACRPTGAADRSGPALPTVPAGQTLCPFWRHHDAKIASIAPSEPQRSVSRWWPHSRPRHIEPTLAFCGFYVARADGKLSNKASKVVLARKGQTTAITMASDYHVATPRISPWSSRFLTDVKKDDIHVIDQAMLDHLDNYSRTQAGRI